MRIADKLYLTVSDVYNICVDSHWCLVSAHRVATALSLSLNVPSVGGFLEQMFIGTMLELKLKLLEDLELMK